MDINLNKTEFMLSHLNGDNVGGNMQACYQNQVIALLETSFKVVNLLSHNNLLYPVNVTAVTVVLHCAEMNSSLRP